MISVRTLRAGGFSYTRSNICTVRQRRKSLPSILKKREYARCTSKTDSLTLVDCHIDGPSFSIYMASRENVWPVPFASGLQDILSSLHQRMRSHGIPHGQDGHLRVWSCNNYSGIIAILCDGLFKRRLTLRPSARSFLQTSVGYAPSSTQPIWFMAPRDGCVQNVRPCAALPRRSGPACWPAPRQPRCSKRLAQSSSEPVPERRVAL